jgi:hypothetical protein
MERGKSGDYIVVKQSGGYSLLLLRKKEAGRFLFEEIDVPEYAINPTDFDWKAWLLRNAPGHSSWTMLLVKVSPQGLQKHEIYSITKRSFLTLNKEEKFFLECFSLSSTPLLSHERRRIGPPPMSGESDQRALWRPSIRFDGQLRKDPSTVYRSKWPKDESPLSDCRIDFYFNDVIGDFPFPIWIDIEGMHFQKRLSVVAAGRNMVSTAEEPFQWRKATSEIELPRSQ